MIESWNIAGGVLEYIDEAHTYIFNGIILPSITQILKVKFHNKYSNVSTRVLKNASDLGTMIHKKIEEYEKYKYDDVDCIELRNYKFLKKHFSFKCIDNEVPIVFFYNEKPFAAGRIDLIIQEKENVGIADIKRTSSFDKEYVAYQTNLYRIGYQQTYGIPISFLRGIHLRNDVRKYYELPINEEKTLELIRNYIEEEKDNE